MIPQNHTLNRSKHQISVEVFGRPGHKSGDLTVLNGVLTHIYIYIHIHKRAITGFCSRLLRGVIYFFTPTYHYFLGLILQGSIIELNWTSAPGPAFAGTHLSSSVFLGTKLFVLQTSHSSIASNHRRDST